VKRPRGDVEELAGRAAALSGMHATAPGARIRPSGVLETFSPYNERVTARAGLAGVGARTGRVAPAFLALFTVFPGTASTCQAAPAAEESKSIWLPAVERELEAVFASIAAEEAKMTVPANPRDKMWVTEKLQHMVNIDQMVRNAFTGPKVAGWGPEARRYFNVKLAARMDRIDRANTAELKSLLKSYRWFTISEFGKDADNHAWLLVQHADHDVAFQKEVLGILTELYPKGETSPSNYAYLWDRVAGHTGNKQRYGTQGRCTGPGTWEPFDVEDPIGLDARRASVGLPSMQVYKQVFKDRELCP